MRVVIADDSVTFRRVMSQCLAAIAGVEVVGEACSGRAAVKMAAQLAPDLITLDLEMPGLNGLEVLDELRARQIQTNVILISALTARGGTLTLEALSKGAFDFITKPQGGGYVENVSAIQNELVPRIAALSHRLGARNAFRDQSRKNVAQHQRAVYEPIRFANSKAKPQLVLIGVSTGGPSALERIVSKLPADLGVPIVVVQHMPALFTRMLAENLGSSSSLPITEAADGEVLAPNHVYVVPGGRHTRLLRGRGNQKVVSITDDPPENNCRPSVDYLFRSVALNFPGEALAVILTGMGSDGTTGLRLLKRHGCRVLAQDENTCVVFGMPKSAIDAGVVDTVLPVGDIADAIVLGVRGVPA